MAANSPLRRIPPMNRSHSAERVACWAPVSATPKLGSGYRPQASFRAAVRWVGGGPHHPNTYNDNLKLVRLHVVTLRQEAGVTRRAARRVTTRARTSISCSLYTLSKWGVPSSSDEMEVSQAAAFSSSSVCADTVTQRPQINTGGGGETPQETLCRRRYCCNEGCSGGRCVVRRGV
jgi:hypothetical protein